MWSVGGVLISLSRPWTRRWINHWSLWRMASATPDLRLPSQPQGITAAWLVPNYTGWWQRNVCEQLAQGCCLKARVWESNPRPSESQVQCPNHYATRPCRYMLSQIIILYYQSTCCLPPKVQVLATVLADTGITLPVTCFVIIYLLVLFRA